jgi:large subunit ribosomal protein L6
MNLSGSATAMAAVSRASPWTKSVTSRILLAVPHRCSHIGKAWVRYGEEVTVQHTPEPPPPLPTTSVFGKLSALTIKGPLGTLHVPIQPFVKLKFHPASELGGLNSAIQVTVNDPTIKKQRAMWGTTRALIANAVQGVTEGFTVSLRLVGVGYRASLEDNGRRLSMKLGFAHSVDLDIPEGIKASVPIPTRIHLMGIDRQKVTQFAAVIRSWREPEPYNQKGIFVGSETIRKKEGKKK